MDLFETRRKERFIHQLHEVDVNDHRPLFSTPSSSSSSSSTMVFAAPESPATEAVKREHMFEKVVTPSDVGKLNRLVIPKQHAEKYFPLDSKSNDKGLLLSFEDPSGKPWRFRYSYWNSSQSYVMTKGWSRFVKEKRLDAGDTVSFGRGVGESERGRLFIDWKRRSDRRNIPPPELLLFHHHHRQGFLFPMTSSSHISSGGGRAGTHCPILDSVPVVHRKAVPTATAAKRVRLFGVNLECPEKEVVVNPEESSSRGLRLLPSSSPPLFPLHLRLGTSVPPSAKEEQP